MKNMQCLVKPLKNSLSNIIGLGMWVIPPNSLNNGLDWTALKITYSKTFCWFILQLYMRKKNHPPVLYQRDSHKIVPVV
jgi:hypothetical protein